MWTRIGGRTIALDAITEILAGKLDAMPKHVRISLPPTCSADIDPHRVAAATPPETATPPGPIAPASGIPSAAVTEAESLRGSPRWGCPRRRGCPSRPRQETRLPFPSKRREPPGKARCPMAGGHTLIEQQASDWPIVVLGETLGAAAPASTPGGCKRPVPDNNDVTRAAARGFTPCWRLGATTAA